MHVAITVVAEIADLAGVFDVAAHWAARAGRHRVWVLWLLIVFLACGCTIVLSLDTTAGGGISLLQLGQAAVWTEARPRGFTLSDVVGWMSRGPVDQAAITHKGRIAVGADAGFAVFAPDD
ncbi:MAG: hypothetical protein ABJA74_15490 [Lapillicoccus sp.]